MEKNRCRWCNMKNELYIAYHDNEWGVPCYEDDKIFELLILEPFQAGLSWETILNKREAFKEAYDGFDAEKIAEYGEEKTAELLNNPKIVRNRLKIAASINNAKIYQEIQKEWGSFSKYIWHFTDGKIIYENDKTYSDLSDLVSGDLKKRGMKFIGTTIVYSFLQAIGVINSHDDACFLYHNGK